MKQTIVFWIKINKKWHMIDIRLVNNWPAINIDRKIATHDSCGIWTTLLTNKQLDGLYNHGKGKLFKDITKLKPKILLS